MNLLSDQRYIKFILENTVMKLGKQTTLSTILEDIYFNTHTVKVRDETLFILFNVKIAEMFWERYVINI